MTRYELPDGVEELLPADAWRMESLRRQVIDQFRCWGYELIMTPHLEFIESLLTGTGKDLDLHTYKLIDQISGRLMGLRADMTPQAARIESRLRRGGGPTRLCYVGTVLTTQPDQLGGSREPFQAGAELFGSQSPEADAEIIRLMIATLRLAGIERPHLDLGHVGIYRELARAASLDPEQENEMFDALRRKSVPDVQQLLESLHVAPPWRELFAALPSCNGPLERIDEFARLFEPGGAPVQEAVDRLRRVAVLAAANLPETPIGLDLAELRGYRYHTGVVFSAFVPGLGMEIARGGRYDNISDATAATGFSVDLRQMLRFARNEPSQTTGVAASWSAEPGWRDEVDRLRAAGERVVVALPGEGIELFRDCDRVLARQGEAWVLQPRETGSDG